MLHLNLNIIVRSQPVELCVHLQKLVNLIDLNENNNKLMEKNNCHVNHVQYKAARTLCIPEKTKTNLFAVPLRIFQFLNQFFLSVKNMITILFHHKVPVV